jgi:molecular chaperone DnaK
MVKDAEAHAEEDKRFHELVQVRNHADTMIHATRKSMEELGDDKLEAGEKAAIEKAIKELEEAMKGDDKEAIEAKTKVLTDASGKMAERLYSQQKPESAGGGAGDQGQSSNAGAEDVVDAEFEEVDDKK